MKIYDNISEADCMEDGADYIAHEPENTGNPKRMRTVDGQLTYRCTRCGQYKPKSEFYSDKRVPCGIRNKCKKCYHK